MPYSPTPRQMEVLVFIASHAARHKGQTPSRKEIQGPLGFTSRRNLLAVLRQLADRGWIALRRDSLTLLHNPPACRAPDGGLLVAVPFGKDLPSFQSKTGVPR